MKKKKTTGHKLYIVQKYVMARNALEADKKSRGAKPDEIFVSNDWKEKKNVQLSEAIGFDDGVEPEEEDV